MPEEMERKLKAQAKKKGFSKERADSYVYGTMRKTGWTPSTQKKKKKDYSGGHHDIEFDYKKVK